MLKTIPWMAAGLALTFVLSGCAGTFKAPKPAMNPELRQRRALQYFVKAKVFEWQNNYYAAIVALRSAADLDPNSATIYERLAHNYNEIGDQRLAEHFAARALALDPDRMPLRYLRFRLFERRSAHDLAAAELEEILVYESRNWALYSILARLYLEIGATESIGVLAEALAKDPQAPPEVRIHLADILERSDRADQALAIYEDVLRTNPEYEDGWLGLADLYMKQGDRQQSLHFYRYAARTLSEDSLAMHELARLLATRSDLEEILHGEEVDFLYRLGLALSDVRQNDLATVVFEYIVGLEPATVKGWLEPVNYYVQIGDYDRVNQLMGKATQALPDSSTLYLFWGEAMVRAERYSEGIAVYQRGLERSPGEKDFYLFWGYALEQQEKWDQAVEVYRQGLVQHPDEVDFYMRWGIVLGRQQRWQEAASRHRKAAAIDSLSSEVYLNWGIALERLKRWEQAIPKLKRAAELDGDDAYILFYLASSLERAAQDRPDSDYFDQSVATFKRLLELNPSDAYALNYLGYMYADRGIHLEEAVELLHKAIELEPDKSAFFDSLGWAYFRLGLFDKAEYYIAFALEKLGEEDLEEQAVIYDHAGDIARALGKNTTANQHWQRVLELAPDNAAARRKLEQAP